MGGGRPRRVFWRRREGGTPRRTSQPRVAVLHPHFVRPLSGGAFVAIARRGSQRPSRIEKRGEKMRERVAERKRHANGEPRLIRQPQLSRSAVLVVAGGSGSGYDVESRNPAAAVGASAHVLFPWTLGSRRTRQPSASRLYSTTRKRPPFDGRASWFPMVAGAGLEPATFGL